MNDSERLVTRFYEAMKVRDVDTMAACYAPDARFSDPVFTSLSGPEVPGMWRMLLGRAKSIEVTFRDVRGDGNTASAHWEARYPFSQTGRDVHNVIDAKFVIENGLIKRHEDTFDLWRWSGMALGAKGRLLGWAPFVQGAIRKKAAQGLADYLTSAVSHQRSAVSQRL